MVVHGVSSEMLLAKFPKVFCELPKFALMASSASEHGQDC